MFCGCVAAQGTVTSQDCQGILAQNVLPSVRKLGLSQQLPKTCSQVFFFFLENKVEPQIKNDEYRISYCFGQFQVISVSLCIFAFFSKTPQLLPHCLFVVFVRAKRKLQQRCHSADKPAPWMINEVEAAIHLFYRFRLTQGGTTLSTTQFAHTHAAQGTLFSPEN